MERSSGKILWARPNRTHSVVKVVAPSWLLAGELVTSAFAVLALAAWLLLLARMLGSLSSPVLDGPLHYANRTSVAAIVPMRNEAENVEGCILSLLEQKGVTKLVAIDDGSSDGTGELLARAAASDGRVEVLTVADVPIGWVGKTNACNLGSARAGDAEWLLFVDADTRLSAGALDRALAYAEERGLDALSLFGMVRCQNAWDRVAVPFYFGLLVALFPIAAVNDPRKTTGAFFVGSFILIRRLKYLEIGGHAAVAGDLVEDKALGRLAKEKGLKVALGFAPEAVSAVWAPGFKNGANALVRVLAPSMRGRIWVSAGYSFAMSVLFLMPFVSLLAGVLAGSSFLLLAAAATLAVELGFALVSAARIAPEVPSSFALGFVPASLVFVAVIWNSVITALRHRSVIWRGREYRI